MQKSRGQALCLGNEVVVFIGRRRSSNLTVEQNGSDTVTALMCIAFKAGYNVACGIETVNDPSFCIEHMSIRINHQTAKCEVIYSV